MARLLALIVLALGVWHAPSAVAAESSATAPLYWSGPVNVGQGEFYGISCPASSLCVAIEESGNIVSSKSPSDEAGAWSVSNVPDVATYAVGQASRSAISCVATATPLCVTTLGTGGRMLISADPTGGAQAWSLTEVYAGAVSCADSTMCVAVGGDGELLSTTDPTGGSGAWHAAQVDGEQEITGISCSSVSLCVAVDGSGNILTSTDPTGGASAWTVTKLATSSFDGQVSCVGTEWCLVIGPSSFVSTDPAGGADSWRPVEGVPGAGGLACAAGPLCVMGYTDTNSGLTDSADPAGGAGAWYHGELGNVGARSISDISCTSTQCYAVDEEGDIFVSAPARQLAVTLLGTGTGAVRSTPVSCVFQSCVHTVRDIIEPAPIEEIFCSDAPSFRLPDVDCALGFPTSNEVTLTPMPEAGSQFTGWGGACAGTGTCELSMQRERAVTATFGPIAAGLTTALTPPKAIVSVRISSLRESNRVFAVGSSSTPLAGKTARRRPRGTVFSFDLNQLATVKLTITRTLRGRREGNRCKVSSRASHDACTVKAAIATLTRVAHAGANTIGFTGRVHNKALSPGEYEATFTATNAAGTSASTGVAFRIVTP